MTDAAALSRTATEPTTVDADNPWPGLLPYRETDREFFFAGGKAKATNYFGWCCVHH